MGPLEVLTTSTAGVVLVAVGSYVLKNLPEWWRHRGEQAAQKADAAAKSQEQAFTLLSQAADRLNGDVKRLDEQSKTQQAQITTQAEQIKELQGSNTTLAEENRGFRRLVLGIVSRLEVIAAWVRDGHQPPPPYTTEQLLEYIRESAPHLGKDT